jgi:peptidoglycan/xylan/chitin deacetylase (PgdA/CDA1 family)
MNLATWIARVGPLRRLFAWLTARVALKRRRSGALAPPWIDIPRDRRYLVLLYHRVNDEHAPYFAGTPPKRFQEDLERMAEQGPALPLAELVARARRRDVPPGAWAVTFDDGYRDNYTDAFPLLRRWNVPATIFLTTGPIDDRKPLWHDRVFDAFSAVVDGTIDVGEEHFALADPASRRTALLALLASLRAMDSAARTRRIDDVIGLLGLTEAPRPDRMLRWEEAKTMVGQGIDFGGHTVTHPILTRLSPEEAAAEIAACRARIHERLGVAATLFAYPNGAREDFDDGVMGAVRDAGFEAAVTTLWGANGADTDPFALRRVGLWHSDAAAAATRLAWTRCSA